MITAAFPATLAVEAAAGDGTRTITGVAVPWDVDGVVASGEVVCFRPGALDVAARPVVLLGHDIARPIGRVTAAADDGRALNVTTRVSRTRDGDEALTLAGDGVLAMFSVGANPTDFRRDENGRLVVTAAEWVELSLLPIGAYTSATVSTVTAQGGTMPEELALDTPTESDDPTPPETPRPDEPVEPDIITAPPGLPITGARGRGRRPDDLSIRQIAELLCAGYSGRIDPAQARARVNAVVGAAELQAQAELINVTMVGADNVAAAVRPTYMVELVELISWGTPTIDALRSGTLERGDYPSKTFSRWTLAPTVGLQATEKAAVTSTAVEITPTSVPVQTWAGGNDISLQTVEFGSPSFVEDYIRAAGIDYAVKSDTYASTTLLAAATNVPTLFADSFIAIVQKLVGALSPATTPPGGLFMAVSNDVGVGLIGVPRDQGPAFWDGAVSFGAFTPTVTAGGLSVFVDPVMPARTYLLGHRQGATWYARPGTPFNLRVNDVNHLGLDVVVYGFGALGIQYPGSFVKTTQPIA